MPKYDRNVNSKQALMHSALDDERYASVSPCSLCICHKPVLH